MPLNKIRKCLIASKMELVSLVFILAAFTALAMGTNETVEEYSHNVKLSTAKPYEHNSNSTIYPILTPTESTLDEGNFLTLTSAAVNWTGDFRKCGKPIDSCNNSDQINYNENPTRCRCDEDCLKYGDCCVTILQNITEVPINDYWRCHTLLDTTRGVRMISKCPSDYLHKLNRELCEDPPAGTRHNASLDVPVLHKKTGDLYRNIFCARCHSVSNKDIYPSNYEVLCSNFTSREAWENFVTTAVYEQGRLLWKDPQNDAMFCRLNVMELHPENITNLIPDVRFCLPGAIEECPIDLSFEWNRLNYYLCNSYTQTVIHQVEQGSYKVYKNPHCARCHHVNLNLESELRCFRTKERGPLDVTMTRGSQGMMTGSVGINVLFDFNLFKEGPPVGYTSKCDDNEILDFIRQKCVPMICPKGYELNDGACEKIVPDIIDITELTDFNGTSNQTESNFTEPTLKNSTDSEPCLLIILHPGDYLELENGSITVNKSGASEVVMFNPGEYEKYNESSMSVCAKHVEKTYSSFAPALSSISNVLLAISVLCSLAHIILYLILPKMRNLPGNNLLCLTTCLLISQFIFLTFIRASNTCVCVAASIIMHYLFLASFCWMNIMSFDIWRTFSSEFLVRRYSGDSMNTFLKYSCFAWIIPLIIVILAVLTDFCLPESLFHDPDFGPLMKRLRPLYGQNNLCWIGQRLSLFVFFAFPVALIILSNCIMFTLTASTIWWQNREGNKMINNGGASVVASNDQANKGGRIKQKIPLHGCNSGSTKRSDTIRFKLYAKLALIMGLTWILGFLSGFTQWEWFWYPFVIFNGLQGTFIFLAFDCKAKVWHMVKDRCGLKKIISRAIPEGDYGSSTESKRRSTTTLSTTLRSLSSRSSTASTATGIALTNSEKGRQGSVNSVKLTNCNL